MVISEQSFVTLCDRYTLSPRQRQIARLMLTGKVHDAELRKAMGIRQGNLCTQMLRMSNKMHCRGRTAILYRFWEDSLAISANKQKT